MRSQDDPSKQPVYAVAKRFVARCLRADGSLFEPDRHVWSKETLDDLHRRFNLAPDESADSFEEKFSRQLAGANAPSCWSGYVRPIPTGRTKRTGTRPGSF